ncbi:MULTISPECIES: hypothetical protein [Rhizobium]|uniref:Uncharacterized protein n=2 Tax=Rhizobium TaxID=379 RepID=A0A7W8XNJ9_9HYPH|nr:hypothetical protein [Rhizobium paranaense]MBB5572535.1 hypothetical protein [Rhizobium paranaense]
MLYSHQHRNGPLSSAHRLRLREDQAMLVLIVAVAIIGSFVVEYLVHLFADNYEIEWAPQADTTNSAQEIVIAMRKTHREIANLNAR